MPPPSLEDWLIPDQWTTQEKRNGHTADTILSTFELMEGKWDVNGPGGDLPPYRQEDRKMRDEKKI